MIWIGKTTASGMARFADAGDVAGGGDCGGAEGRARSVDAPVIRAQSASRY
jgi:hypothetical protein